MAWENFDSTYQSFTDASASARVGGAPELLADTVAVPLTDAAAAEEVTMIYEAHEVLADKAAATAIDAGDLVRVTVNNGRINKAATSNTNKACGFARETITAAQARTKIKIRFDGRPRGA